MSSVKNDPATALGNLWNSVVKEGARAAGEARKLVAESIDDIGKATTSGGVVGGALQAFEELSPGNFAAGAVDVLTGRGELDPKLAAGIRGGVNLLVGAMVPGPGLLLQAQALKDAAGAFGMLGGAPTSPASPPAGQHPGATQQQSPERPSEAGRRTGGSPTGRAEWSTEKRARIEEAKAKAKEEIKSKAREANQNGRIADLEGRVAYLEKLMGVQENKPGGGYGGNTDVSGGFVTIDFSSLKGSDLRRGVDRLKDNISGADDEISRILDNPNLSFEDMIFMLMNVLVKQQQAEVKDMTKDLREKKADFDAEKKGLRAEIKKQEESVATLRGKASADPKNEGVVKNLGLAESKLKGMTESLTDRQNDFGDSRQENFEAIKNAMNKLSEMQQSLSNILNTMHQRAMNTIGNIR
jgi:hypothetical protein